MLTSLPGVVTTLNTSIYLPNWTGHKKRLLEELEDNLEGRAYSPALDMMVVFLVLHAPEDPDVFRGLRGCRLEKGRRRVGIELRVGPEEWILKDDDQLRAWLAPRLKEAFFVLAERVERSDLPFDGQAFRRDVAAGLASYASDRGPYPKVWNRLNRGYAERWCRELKEKRAATNQPTGPMRWSEDWLYEEDPEDPAVIRWLPDLEYWRRYFEFVGAPWPY